MSENKYFAQALSNFTHDVASGGAICHLADLGYTVKEISKELLYPTPVKRIQETVWKHYIDMGIICLTNPHEQAAGRISYVKEYGKYGRVSFRQVVERAKENDRAYLPCDFGRQIYKDKGAFEEKLAGLGQKDRDYILGLPWPMQTVYHVADERMKRIYDLLGK